MEYYDLGRHSRPVTTSSPEAQTWFDRGLVWTYGFNHEEAVYCFEQALHHDPDTWGSLPIPEPVVAALAAADDD